MLETIILKHLFGNDFLTIHLKLLIIIYTSIDPKHQQTMFPRRSCVIKNSLGAPFLKKETKEKKGDKPRNPSPDPEGARKSRWNTILFLDMLMEQNARTLGRQSPEP